MLPVIPFAKLPRKQYRTAKQAAAAGLGVYGFDRKKRMDITSILQEYDPSLVPPKPIVEEVEESSESESSESEFSEDSFDLLEHLADLLPSEVDEKGRPTGKKANNAHLQDLKEVKVAKDRFKYFKEKMRQLQEWRAKERIRRKHYLLTEYENRIREFDEHQKKLREDQAKEEEKQVALEALRRTKRIERNSIKKKTLGETTAHFLRDLTMREKDAIHINFYCRYLSKWGVEGNRKKMQDAETAKVVAVQRKQQADAQLAMDSKQARIEYEKSLLEDDRNLTKKVERMMLRYGMLSYEPGPEKTAEEKVEMLLTSHAAAKASKASAKLNRKAREELEEVGEEGEGDGEDRGDGYTIGSSNGQIKHVKGKNELLLNIRSDINHAEFLKRLRRHRLKVSDSTGDIETHSSAAAAVSAGAGAGEDDDSQATSTATSKRVVVHSATVFPKEIDFEDTSEVQRVRGYKLKEVGALGLAAEISRGACPLMDELNLKDNDIRDNGFLRILQSLKLASLFTIQVLDLRGNHLSAVSVDHLRDSCVFGVFNDLQVLNLNNNELRDDGADAVVRLIASGTVRSLREIHLQNNSITNKGFSKVMKLLLSVQEVQLPMLERISLQNNIISVESKRSFHPIPTYFAL